MKTKNQIILIVLLATVAVSFIGTVAAKDFESSSVPVISSQIPQNATIIDQGHGTVRTLEHQKDYYNTDWVLISADGNIICYVTSYDNSNTSDDITWLLIFMLAIVCVGIFSFWVFRD